MSAPRVLECLWSCFPTVPPNGANLLWRRLVSVARTTVDPNGAFRSHVASLHAGLPKERQDVAVGWCSTCTLHHTTPSTCFLAMCFDSVVVRKVHVEALKAMFSTKCHHGFCCVCVCWSFHICPGRCSVAVPLRYGSSAAKCDAMATPFFLGALGLGWHLVDIISIIMIRHVVQVDFGMVGVFLAVALDTGLVQSFLQCLPLEMQARVRGGRTA